MVKSIESIDYVISAKVEVEHKDTSRFGFMASAKHTNLRFNKFVKVDEDATSSCVDISVILSKDIITANKLDPYCDIASTIIKLIDYNGYIQLDNISICTNYVHMALTLLM